MISLFQEEHTIIQPYNRITTQPQSPAIIEIQSCSASTPQRHKAAEILPGKDPAKPEEPGISPEKMVDRSIVNKPKGWQIDGLLSCRAAELRFMDPQVNRYTDPRIKDTEKVKSQKEECQVWQKF